MMRDCSGELSRVLLLWCWLVGVIAPWIQKRITFMLFLTLAGGNSAVISVIHSPTLAKHLFANEDGADEEELSLS